MIRKRKRLWAAVLSAALVLTQLPAAALAGNAAPEDGAAAPFAAAYRVSEDTLAPAEPPAVKAASGGADILTLNNTITEGGITVAASNGGEVAYTEGSGFILKSDGNYTVSGTWNGSLTTSVGSKKAVITVPSGVTANVTLDGVTIDVNTTDYAAAFSVAAGGRADITLLGTSALTSGRYCAGLQVPKAAGVSLGGSGKLTATGGIGGGSGGGGSITISGGTVTATGGTYGAGIGGGDYGGGGSIIISGGTVTATGRDGGAGIGGCCCYYATSISDAGSGGRVQISGQGTTVIATGDGGSDVGKGSGGKDSGSLSVTDGAKLTMTENGTNADTQEYQNCTIIGKSGSTVYDGAGKGTTQWDGNTDTSASELGVSKGVTILITGDGDGTLTIDVADVTVTSGGRAVRGPVIEVDGGIDPLTIRDLDLTAREEETAIFFAYDATLKVEGTCTVTGGADSVTGNPAIYSDGALTVAVGDASLTVVGGTTTATYSGGFGLVAFTDLTVEVGGKGSLHVVGGDSGDQGGVGLAAQERDLTVRNDGVVLAEGGKAGGMFSGTGIAAANVTLSGSGTTTARGASGIRTEAGLTVGGTGTVTAEGVSVGVGFSVPTGSGSHRLAGDGTLIAAGIGGTWLGNGIQSFDGPLELAFTGSLTARGGSGTQGCGIYVKGGDLKVSEAPAYLDVRPGAGTDRYALWYDSLVNSSRIPDGVFVKGGDVPSDSAYYGRGAEVTVLGNTGNLTRSGYDFAGWEYAGTTYAAGQSFSMPAHDVVLTARWNAHSTDGSHATVVTPTPLAKEPNPPTVGTVKPEVSVKDGRAEVTVTDQDIQSAIDKATSQAKKDGKEANGIAVSLDLGGLKAEFNRLPLTLSKSAYAKLVEAGVKYLSIKTPQISLSLDLATLRVLEASATGDVTINAVKAENKDLPAALQGRPAYNLTVTTGGKTISNFGAGFVAVTLPYALQAGEQGGNLQMAYIDAAAGNIQYMTDSSYDAGSKALLGRTSHFTVFGIAEKPAPVFTDIGGHWAEDDTLFAAGRELLDGTGGGVFSPDAGMTRGMLAAALYRLAGSPQASGEGGAFTDVPLNASYADAVGWAASRGVIDGVTATTFAPGRVVTRQELAVILQSYARTMGCTLPRTREAVAFADGSSIAGWAADAVEAMQTAGILMGKDGNRYDPTGAATRAEVSAALRRYVELVVDPQTAQGWDKNDNGKWMYFVDGKQATGARTIDGTIYHFDGNGLLTKVDAVISETKKQLTYVVRKDDTLWSISAAHNCTAAEIAALNKALIGDSNKLLVGWELIIPQK